MPMRVGMLSADLQLARLVALVALALLLGIGVLEADGSRRAAEATAAPAPAPAQAVAQPASSPGVLVADAPVATRPAPPAQQVAIERRGGVACATPHQLVHVPRAATLRARPGGRPIGTLPASSAYLGQSMVAWVQELSADGRWGRLTMPWSKPVGRSGWVRLDGMRRSTTRTMVIADLSDRTLRVYRGCEELLRVPTAIGRAGSPSPRGRFWVSDRVAVPAAQQASFGSFAFGLSTVQPKLPAGWSGGDQMAIHGTGAPGSIGQAASAGCLRVGEAALARLRPLLRGGTPVIIQA